MSPIPIGIIAASGASKSYPYFMFHDPNSGAYDQGFAFDDVNELYVLRPVTTRAYMFDSEMNQLGTLVMGTQDPERVLYAQDGKVYIPTAQTDDAFRMQVFEGLPSSGLYLIYQGAKPTGNNVNDLNQMFIDSAGNMYITGEAIVGSYYAGGFWKMTSSYAPAGYRMYRPSTGANASILGSAFDGSYIYTLVWGPTTDEIDINKTNLSLGVVWQKSISGWNTGASTAYRSLDSVAVDESGNLYVSPPTYTSTAERTQLYKINSSGTMVWAKEFSGGFNDQYSQAVAWSNGGCYVIVHQYINSSTTYINLIKLDTNGNIVWQRRITPSKASTGWSSMKVAQNGDLLLYVEGGYSTSSTMFIRYPADGSITGTFAYGSITATTDISIANVSRSTATTTTSVSSSSGWATSWSSSGTVGSAPTTESYGTTYKEIIG